ncbi:hypothetical protein SHOU24_60 [Vibrio phage SHOU24]|uniref:tail length tape measure protein n=1 Tax=Vibrio phage SHOU24 TaxID=1414739 RepID=UPI0003ED2183|nr:tail length tape measure protein [Vibrio phage SHOU24]AHI61257.1 hypothetical protein SHOU24_60 [Vibrio phage SHOU24]
MSFNLDFNSASAEQKVESLISRLEKMTAAASEASKSLIPSSKAIEELRKVAEAQTSISKSMQQVASVSEKATKQVEKDSRQSETSVKRFFDQLDRSIENNSHKVNAWRGTYGSATQDMVRANQQLKKEAMELAAAQEAANKARFAQAKTVNAQLVAEEKSAIDKRQRDWTDYYKKQETQIARYTNFLKQSQDTWTASAQSKRQMMAAQMKKIAEQETKFEIEEARKRSKAWTDYYTKQEAQISRYNKALSQSRAVYAKNTNSYTALINQKKKGTAELDGNTRAMGRANNATAMFRAGMSALSLSFGIYTSGTIIAATATYAFVSSMQQTVLVGAEFEKSMYRIYAVTGQMGEAYEKNGNLYVSTAESIINTQNQMADAALHASKVTVFTAVQAAEGMVALGMAGLNAQQAIGALTPSLQLAQIGMIDVYESADIMTNVMLGFSMSIASTAESLKNATRVTDILAAAITNSNSTIKEMSKSLSYVAPVAHAAGGSIEETVAALETFHNVGIKGSRAGTALRRAYVNLLEPTDKVASVLRDLGVSVRDTEGDMYSLTEIMQELEKAGATTADIVSIFGVRAAPAMIAFQANLKDIVRETNRLKTSVDGAGKAMADFMATSTSGQWQIINSKIQSKMIDAFEKAQPAVKKLNYAIMELVDNDLDFFFDSVSQAIVTASHSAKFLADNIGWVVEQYENFRKAERDMYLMFLPMFKTEADMAGGASFSKIAADIGADAGNAGTGTPKAEETFSKFFETAKATNNELGIGVTLTEEQVAELKRKEEFNRRNLEFARLETEILKDNSLAAESTRAQTILSMKNENIEYQAKLNLITKEEALKAQIANVDSARLQLNQKFANETAKLATEMQKIKDINTGTASDTKAYAELLRKQAQLNEQIIAQTDKLNAEQSKLVLSLQEDMMKAEGFGKHAKEVKEFATKLEVANEKLKGNKQASEENTLAQYRNAIARRENFQSTSAFNMLSEQQRAAFIKETEAIKAQLPELQKLIDENKRLTDEKKKAKEAEKDFAKMMKDFGKGKGLGEEGKGTMQYITDMERLSEYLESRKEIMAKYGLEEVEFARMIAEAKEEIEQSYWDSQHEHLAKWRDDWSEAVANNIEEALFMEQSWTEAAKNISREMLGTVVNTMVRVGAEMAANHLMKKIFTTEEIAMDSMVTSAKVANEGVKQASNMATAATEQASAASSLAFFTQMLGLGPSLAAAWGPAAMFINIASFGAAAAAAAGTMLLAGAASAAAGLMTGVASGIGENISGSRQFGGPVQAGKSYLVGETGREIFTPETNGYILNNQASNNLVSGNSGGNVYYITYDNKYMIDATGNEDFEERLGRAMEEAAEMGKQKVAEDLSSNGQIAKLSKMVSRT